MSDIATLRRLLKLRYAGHHWKPHRWVLSRDVWDAVSEDSKTASPQGVTLLDWTVVVIDVLPADYAGVEKV